MRNPLIYLVVSALTLAACGTELSIEGAKVAQRDGEIANCKHLGIVEGSESMGMSVADDRRSALNQVRNNVALLGGNAFVINDRFTTGLNTSIQADAYKC